MSDVARAAGVTATAVSALFKGRFYGGESAGRRTTVGISAEARARILETARKLNYEPVDASWRLRLYPERGDTCFLLPSNVTDGLANPYFGRFVNGALSRLHAEGRHLAFAYFDPGVDYEREGERLPGPIQFHQASTVLVAGNPNESLLRVLMARGLPTAYLSRMVDTPGVHCFAPDYAEAVRLQFARLRKLGHERIAVAAGAHLHGSSYAWSQLRPAVTKAWAEFYPEATPMEVFADVVDGRGGYPLWDAIRALRPQPTAVAFLEDYSARMTMQGAMRAKVRVPQDMGFLGMNNDLMAHYAPVPLTTVDFGGEAMGAAAVELLAGRAAWGAKLAEPVRRYFPVKLVERESLAAV